jgi:hypothetical protein
MVSPALRTLDNEMVFEVFGDPVGAIHSDDGSVHRKGELLDPMPYFSRRVRTVEPWWWLVDPHNDDHRRHPPRSLDEALDFVQALYEIALITTAAEPTPNPDAIARGRACMRELVDPALELLEPPLRLTEDGTIVGRLSEQLDSLADKPLPEDLDTSDIDAPVHDAVARYRRRDATDGDRQSACVTLAGVLERLQKVTGETKVLLSKDEDRLFEIANQFALRHNNADQRSDYELGPFLEWVFHCQLATIQLCVRLGSRSRVPS